MRVRFAPSPTGALHIGGVRTALYNYILAKQHNGTFVLRLEDTDQNRFVEGAEKHIFDSLEWCGIIPDESSQNPGKYGPYKQSDRLHIYKKYVDILIEKGSAYYAFDSKEDLEKLRTDAEKKGEAFMYNSLNRKSLKNSITLDIKETQRLIATGNFVIRFKTKKQNVECSDLIRGNITHKGTLLDDKILFKSDGMPTYHLANVVDDHLMEITHVIRGEEWLPSLPLHILLYNAFGWNIPTFTHLPLILKPNGNGKLSKRDTETLGIPIYAVAWNNGSKIHKGFKEMGYLPEALINFLVLLGWNPGNTKEIFSINELIKTFDLKSINLSGAKFDVEKLNWFNHSYIQHKEDKALALTFKRDLETRNIKKSLDELIPIISFIKDRAHTTTDFWELSKYLFEKPTHYNEKVKVWDENTPKILSIICGIVENSTLKADILEDEIKKFAASEKIPMANIMKPLRLALVGDLFGISIFYIIVTIGKKETLERINHFLSTRTQ